MSDIEQLDVLDSETTCAVCYAEFLYPDDLAVHITQVHSETTQIPLVRCQFCSEYLSDMANYALHLRDEHLPNLSCCKYCNRVFQDFDQYRKHESKHYTYVPKSMFSCSQCGKLYSNVFELELHEQREHPNAPDGVLLNNCLPFLSSLLNIKALKFLQSLHDDVVYICVCCELSTPDVREYLQHLKDNRCQSPACDMCSSVYRTKNNLIKHYQTHIECFHNSQPQYKQCSECCKMFEIKLWRRHTNNCRPIKCRTCNVIYSTMNELARHQSENHPSTVVLEMCKYCHRHFAGNSSLEKHMERTHSDLHLYKYKCVHCNSNFKHPKKLFAHFRSTHKDLEPYTCKICDEKFKFRKQFTIHIKLEHQGIGYIEFDKNYHVFFSAKKSDRPFNPNTISSQKEEESEYEVCVIRSCKEDNLNPVKKQKHQSNEKISEKNVKINLNNDNEDENYVRSHTNQKTMEKQNEDENDQVNLNSDLVSATETEGNQIEIQAEQVIKEKRTRKRCRQRSKPKCVVLDSSDDETLLEIQKRAKRIHRAKLNHATWNRKKQINLKNNKKRFICDICKKYCYTFQNYHNHFSTHYANATLKCVKCLKTFSSKDDLSKHCSEEHSSSQLTQTLKNLLAKRKNGEYSEVTMAKKFQRTIKSVEFPEDTVNVTVKAVNSEVKNFIESFTPEDVTENDESVEINNSTTMRSFVGLCKEPLIKMTKCNLTPIDYTVNKLNLPVPFRQVIGETHKVTIKQIFSDPSPDINQEYMENNNESDNYDSDYDRSESIPDIAQEVMLDEAEDQPPKTHYVPHKVVLPKLPKEFNKVHIAHLQVEKPYYKIVKVQDVLNTQENKFKEKIPESETKTDIQLPDGTKFVTVNPLAHLLGDTPMEKILGNIKSKYYQPKPKDFEMAIAKAMLKLENPSAFPKKKRKKSDVEK